MALKFETRKGSISKVIIWLVTWRHVPEELKKNINNSVYNQYFTKQIIIINSFFKGHKEYT